MVETTSILNTIKLMIGLSPDYNAFDTSIIVGINSAISILNQIGIGSTNGFSITGQDEEWSEYLDQYDQAFVEMVKHYIYLRTLYMFDKSMPSSALNAIKEEFTELESRINYAFDVPQ